MNRYALMEVTPPRPPGVSCRYFLTSPEQTDRNTILIVSFEGEYPDGSRGNAHGAYVSTAALHGVHAFNPDGVVLDFRGLSYRWGNTLLAVFQDISQFKDAGADPDEPAFPIVVVTSEKSREGVLSLLTPRGEEPPEWHFEDLDLAIHYGMKEAKEWLEG